MTVTITIDQQSYAFTINGDLKAGLRQATNQALKMHHKNLKTTVQLQEPTPAPTPAKSPQKKSEHP